MRTAIAPPAASHRFVLVGCRADTTYQARLVLFGPSGRMEGMPLDFKIGPLPPGLEDLRIGGSAGAARFIGQHAVGVTAGGDSMIFDNGDRERPWSRALALRVDETARQASIAREHRLPADLYSFAISSACAIDTRWRHREGRAPFRRQAHRLAVGPIGARTRSGRQ